VAVQVGLFSPTSPICTGSSMFWQPWKSLASLLAFVLMFAACAKRPTSPAFHLVLPHSCVTDMQFNQKTVCHALQNGRFSCDGIVVQAACVKNSTKLR